MRIGGADLFQNPYSDYSQTGSDRSAGNTVVQGVGTSQADGSASSSRLSSTGQSSKSSPAAKGSKSSGPAGAPGAAAQTQEQAREIEKLKKTDSKVKAHEQAHVAAGGQYVRGGPNFSYTSGPDGKQYATGGEVSIDSSPVADDPRATIQKMTIVKGAALAPADPSGQDMRVAAAADAAATQAAAELAKSPAGNGKASAYGSAPPSKGQNINLSI